jgi:hypothetical protein
MKKIRDNDLRLVSIVIGIIASLMIIFPALIVKDTNTTYTGLQVVFGYRVIDLGIIGSGEIKFSFLNLLAYSLPLIAAIVLLVSKNDKKIATIIFAVAVIMLILVPVSTIVHMNVLGNVSVIDVDWGYRLGLNIAALLALIGLGLGLVRLIKKD